MRSAALRASAFAAYAPSLRSSAIPRSLALRAALPDGDNSRLHGKRTKWGREEKP